MSENLDLWRSAEIGRLEDALLRFAPFRQWEVQTVTFPATANTDLDIAHSLTPSSDEAVVVLLIQSAQPLIVWQDTSATRTAWAPGIVRVRATAPSAIATLLLFVFPASQIGLLNPNNAPYTFTLPGLSSGEGVVVGVAGSSAFAGDSWLGPGLKLGSRWDIGVRDQGGSDFAVMVTDRTNGYTPLMIRQSGGEYFVQPGPTSNVTEAIYLGNPNDSFSTGYWTGLYVGAITSGAITSSGEVACTNVRMSGRPYEQGRSVSMGDWQNYTPALTAATTNPSIGNGTLTGRYAQVGDTVHWRVTFSAGSTTTFGTGDWRISLPVAATASDEGLVYGYARDNSTSTRYLLNAGHVTSSTLALFADVSTTNVSPTVPFTWAQDDSFRLAGSYEID